ncbi:TonB-dependent receptor [Fulvivirga ulvae]|uniref:TonB-dependent receptor plug domain-containing protein n=1 Tax=Fulvivirga ulvae TaxID=2904245 RepID=UPI001F248939|nr:TonB-dependent receptor [Fulvivirga ulvae]UII32017.1 TonB-dependent receptor [Fulvivirga ulvae]
MKKLLAFFLISALSFGAMAQDDGDLYELSLEDLMQIDIYSVSKKAESLFDAPLSSSTLTSDEIVNSGATSIPEALRLIPGLIVREQANGVYDVHLRGLDNLTRYGNAADAGNLITLIMIDGRPVFNNNLGGVYWEAIPIGLIDVERIEVVRGPSAPLYGPNAVAGVINIITKNITKDGVTAHADLRAGTNNTQIGGVNVGYKFSEKFSAALSGNFEIRDRHDDQYFDYATGSFTDYANITDITPNYIKDQDQALDKKGVNLFMDYTPTERFSLQLQSGLQDASIQKVYQDNTYTPFSNGSYESKYVSINTTFNNLRGRFSFVDGYDNLDKAATFPLLKYDYKTIDASIEYDLSINEKLSIRPGLSYQSAQYSDEPYVDPENGILGVLNDEQTIRSFAGSLGFDYDLTEDWRIVGGIRMDKFSTPDEAYISYQLATTYNLNEKNLIRAVYAKSNSGSFIGPNYVNIVFPSNGNIVNYTGNEDLDLFQIQMVELGYRSKISNNLELNIELFRQVAENAYVIIFDAAPGLVSYTYENIDAKAKQNGVTLSANYVASNKFQVKPFITYQKTEVEDLPTGYRTANVDPVNNINNTVDVDNDQTPSLFGGLYLNYKPVKNLNINLNPYYMGEQNQYSFYSLSNPASDIGEIDSKLILNAKIGYDITKNINIYLNARNLADNDSREFIGADRNGRLLLGGVRVQL